MVAVPFDPKLRTVVVGTPSYFTHRELPRAPDDLAKNLYINYRLIGGGGLLPWAARR